MLHLSSTCKENIQELSGVKEGRNGIPFLSDSIRAEIGRGYFGSGYQCVRLKYTCVHTHTPHTHAAVKVT